MFRLPSDPAGLCNIFRAYDQIEFVRNSNRTFDRKSSTAAREIFDGAIDDGTIVVEDDLASLECALALVPSFFHEAPVAAARLSRVRMCAVDVGLVTWPEPLRNYTDL